MISNYYIALIIILIITSIISLALYVYFVYLPAARASDQLDIINTEALRAASQVNEAIDNITVTTTQDLNDICVSICNAVLAWNEAIGPNPPFPALLPCPLDQRAIPAFCNLSLDNDCQPIIS